MKIVSIWLRLADEDGKYLSNIIKDLGKKFDAPIFTPHLTIYGSFNTEPELVIQAAKEAIKGVKPFEIDVDKLNYTDQYFKTVFIEFKQNNSLTLINQKLTEKLSKYGKYVFKPHISLIYQNMSDEKKLKIIKSLNVKNVFNVSRIAVIIGNDDQNKVGVASWQILFTQEL